MDIGVNGETIVVSEEEYYELKDSGRLCLKIEQQIEDTHQRLRSMYVKAMDVKKEVVVEERRLQKLKAEMDVLLRQMSAKRNQRLIDNNILTQIVHNRTKK